MWRLEFLTDDFTLHVLTAHLELCTPNPKSRRKNIHNVPRVFNPKSFPRPETPSPKTDWNPFNGGAVLLLALPGPGPWHVEFSCLWCGNR